MSIKDELNADADAALAAMKPGRTAVVITFNETEDSMEQAVRIHGATPIAMMAIAGSLIKRASEATGLPVSVLRAAADATIEDGAEE